MARAKQQHARSLLKCVFLLLLGIAVLRSSISVLRVGLGSQPHLSEEQSMELNRTLFRYSLQDPWTAEERQRLKFLLDEDGMQDAKSVRKRWERSLFGKSRLGLDSYRTSRKPRGRLPLELLHPRYLEHWTPSSRDLLEWLGKKKYEPRVMNELLSLVKEPLDKHFNRTCDGPLRPYRDCAVVGNSGILLNRTYGSVIDEHEVVIRLNNARIVGFQRYVGSKTTFSFVNSNILTLCSKRPGCSCHPYGPDVPFVAYVCQALHFVHFRLCSALSKTPIFLTDPRFDVLSMRIVKYYSLKRFFATKNTSIEQWSKTHDGDFFHYSSGMQAVLLALGVCEKVDVFGFGKSPSSKHHYHTNQKGELNLHDYEAEYAFYDDLVKGRPVPFLSESGFKIPSLRVFS